MSTLFSHFFQIAAVCIWLGLVLVLLINCWFSCYVKQCCLLTEVPAGDHQVSAAGYRLAIHDVCKICSPASASALERGAAAKESFICRSRLVAGARIKIQKLYINNIIKFNSYKLGAHITMTSFFSSGLKNIINK